LKATPYIVVEGPIGVGKTALTQMLAKRLGGRPILELVEENPFLASFYADRNKYAFQTQLFFLLSRFKQQQELSQPELFAQATVSDYLFAKDRLFAQLNLDPHEFLLYDKIYELLGPRVVKPDLVVHLSANLDVLLARIRRRGRDFERRFDAAYLEKLTQAYNEFFFTYEDSPLLVVNTSDIDFVQSQEDFEGLLSAIGRMKKGVQAYHPVSNR
jgi:deoxyadenosine/deoxycytidine kinase